MQQQKAEMLLIIKQHEFSTNIHIVKTRALSSKKILQAPTGLTSGALPVNQHIWAVCCFMKILCV